MLVQLIAARVAVALVLGRVDRGGLLRISRASCSWSRFA
jgi:hypothetical protein